MLTAPSGISNAVRRLDGLNFKLSFCVGIFAAASVFASQSCPQLLSGNYSVIVYPESSGGKNLAAYLRANEPRLTPTYVVKPGAFEDRYKTGYFEPDQYAAGFSSDKLEQTIQALQRHPVPPAVVLAGDESAVDVVDDIREALRHPYANDYRLKKARFHKGALGDALAAAGLTHVRQAYSSKLEDLLHWHRTVYQQFPVVVKPVDSGATDGVQLCYSEKEIVDYFNSQVGKQNACGRVNVEFVIQERLFVEENEFVVEIVAEDGQFKVFLVGKYSRQLIDAATYIVTGGRALDARDPKLSPLIEYAFNVLKAVGFRNGPAHLEIVATPEGYKIVDFNSRIAGTWPSLGQLANGQNLYEWIRMSVLDKSAFAALPTLPKLVTPAAFYTVRSEYQDAEFSRQTAAYNESFVKSRVGSVKTYSQTKQPGAPFGRPRTLFDLGAIIELANPTEEGLRSDLQRLADLDQSGFFYGSLGSLTTGDSRANLPLSTPSSH